MTEETYLHFTSIHLQLGYFFCIKSGTCQSRKQPKKLKVNFRKWHVSKLNLIFSPRRSVTKAPVSRLINNSTPPRKTKLTFLFQLDRFWKKKNTKSSNDKPYKGKKKFICEKERHHEKRKLKIWPVKRKLVVL